jgi:hypothetical protein
MISRLQWLVCVAASLLLAVSAPSLVVEAEALYICCDDPSDCSGDKVCCASDILGLPPCGNEGDGYCVTKCTRILVEERR